MQAGVLAAALAGDAALQLRGAGPAGRLAVLLGGLLLFAYLQASWGGDMMRSHLRAVSPVARHACPCCGHSLQGHLAEPGAAVRCPECGTDVDRAVFSPPYPIPRQLRVFPPWRAGRGIG